MSDPIRPPRENIFFDSEFVHDGKTIMPISLGLVKETGEELYMEFRFDRKRAEAHDFVRETVLPLLQGKEHPIGDIRRMLIEFCGLRPLFWAWFAAHDWLLLTQVFGTFEKLPTGWPMFCMDLRQSFEEKGARAHWLPQQPRKRHHALEDALWARKTYFALYPDRVQR